VSAADKHEATHLHARLVIFPSTRRRRMIQRTAALAASSKNPERTILATIKRTHLSHARKNLASEAIQHDLRELETALRAQVAFFLSDRGMAQ
jgi:hypothetical protein